MKRENPNQTAPDGEAAALGTGCPITRRDFVGSTLAAAGTGMLTSALPGSGSIAHAQGLDKAAWTGPGGIGDYARSNGNTAEVVNAAHRIRDGLHDSSLGHVTDTKEVYDLVVVGGGVAGMSAAYALHKKHGGTRRCLVLENHPMFGGESKGNLIEIDGHVLAAPQGANQGDKFTTGPFGELYRELGIPADFEFAKATGTSRPLKIANDHYDLLFNKQKLATTGYYLGAEHGWFRDPTWQDGYASLPWPEDFKRTLTAWFSDKRDYAPEGIGGKTTDPLSSDDTEDPTEDTALARWLDTMTYANFIRDHMKLDPAAIATYVDPYIGTTLGGSLDTVSAYGARILGMPGVGAAGWRWVEPQDVLFAFPMGNAVYPRYLVRAMIPDAYSDNSLKTMVYGRTRHEALDRRSNATRVRLSSTVVRVEHEGGDEGADLVTVTYDKGGKLYQVRARGVVMACGGWVNRRVVKGMPSDLLAGYHTFTHTPVLVANVAVRHWRYLDKLGISAARWFDGFGFATNLRRPMRIDGKAEPLSPDKPTILTFYVPFMQPGLPAQAQTVMGRQRLFETSFAGFEHQIRKQLQDMFGAHGFDAKRDIGAIVLNRWGHALAVPQPGFFFGTGGKPSARDLARKGFGRIAFGCAELQGHTSWLAAFNEGRRAALQLI
jgi:spermidine dehydrogenase